MVKRYVYLPAREPCCLCRVALMRAQRGAEKKRKRKRERERETKKQMQRTNNVTTQLWNWL